MTALHVSYHENLLDCYGGHMEEESEMCPGGSQSPNSSFPLIAQRCSVTYTKLLAHKYKSKSSMKDRSIIKLDQINRKEQQKWQRSSWTQGCLIFLKWLTIMAI